jgi:hypothetical protein
MFIKLKRKKIKEKKNTKTKSNNCNFTFPLQRFSSTNHFDERNINLQSKQKKKKNAIQCVFFFFSSRFCRLITGIFCFPITKKKKKINANIFKNPVLRKFFKNTIGVLR